MMPSNAQQRAQNSGEICTSTVGNTAAQFKIAGRRLHERSPKTIMSAATLSQCGAS